MTETVLRLQDLQDTKALRDAVIDMIKAYACSLHEVMGYKRDHDVVSFFHHSNERNVGAGLVNAGDDFKQATQEPPAGSLHF